MAPNPVATLDTTMGSFKVELYLDRVPITASNFIDLAQSGFYNGIHFHRVIPGFMDQFGCPKARDPACKSAGTGGPPDGSFKNLKTGTIEKRSNGGNIKDENISRDTNAPGTLSMANTGRPNSGGSQFFLNVNNNANLDWFSSGASKHPVFGKIVEGYAIAVAISKVPTRNDNPIKPIKMNKITISFGGADDEPAAKRTRTEAPTEVRVLHIIRKHRGSRRPSSWRQDKITCTEAEAAEFVTGLRKQLAGKPASELRKKFEALAKEHSDCNSAKKGGDLGSFAKGKMQPAFSDASFKLSVGEMSELVTTDSGVHIIMRID